MVDRETQAEKDTSKIQIERMKKLKALPKEISPEAKEAAARAVVTFGLCQDVAAARLNGALMPAVPDPQPEPEPQSEEEAA